jgi:hypothetical protein
MNSDGATDDQLGEFVDEQRHAPPDKHESRRQKFLLFLTWCHVTV